MDISIRPIHPSEYSFLREMLFEAIFDPDPDLPRSIVDQPNMAKYIKDWGQPNDQAFVALAAEELVGAIWCRQLKATNPGYGYLADDIPELGLAVKPTFRNQGIGTKLLKELIRKISINGVPALSLSVDKRNPAIHLYKRAGFNIVKEEETAFTMKLEIDLFHLGF